MSDSMNNFVFKKKYGQNFLQNIDIIKKIAKIGEVSENSLIIEIGPGSGNLTVELAKMYGTCKILAYEIDNSLKDILSVKIKDYSNVEILFADFLKEDIIEAVSKYKFNKLYFISNVPYYITTPILFKLIYSGLSFERIVMMVQKEVGDRFCSNISKKEYGALTVILNYFFIVKKEFIVNRNNFYPVPNVDSVVVSFTKKEKLEELIDREHFINLIHASFKFRRKTIRNNLQGYNLYIVEKILNKYGYDLNVRAENLSYKIFIDLSNALVLE